MRVNNKEMYHLHHAHLYSDIWQVGNSFTVDDNFQAYYLNILKYFNSGVKFSDNEYIEFNKIIDYYLQIDQPKDVYIQMLKDASTLIRCANIFKREMTLEEVRKEYYPKLPSRKHSIWLCDEKSLEFWKKELIDEKHQVLELYKLSVSGNLFKSSDSFLPDNTHGYETNIKESHDYWNPLFKNEEEEKRAEYLFQGEVKILELVK